MVLPKLFKFLLYTDEINKSCNIITTMLSSYRNFWHLLIPQFICFKKTKNSNIGQLTSIHPNISSSEDLALKSLVNSVRTYFGLNEGSSSLGWFFAVVAGTPKINSIPYNSRKYTGEQSYSDMKEEYLNAIGNAKPNHFS